MVNLFIVKRGLEGNNMKDILISIKPYWVFLIIAKTMGWNIDKEKTVEVRKTYPQDDKWNKVGKIYCTKDKKSFNHILKKYQPFMEKFLGKVVGEFICDYIYENMSYDCEDSRVSVSELQKYANGKPLYGWHISNLKIYDEPKELSEFKKINRKCWYADLGLTKRDCLECKNEECYVSRPPQSWCYVEDIV